MSERKKEAIDRILQGDLLEDVALNTGLAVNTVRKYCSQEGVAWSRKSNSGTNTLKVAARIVDSNADLSISDIANELNRPVDEVREIYYRMKRAGFQICRSTN